MEISCPPLARWRDRQLSRRALLAPRIPRYALEGAVPL